MFRSIYLVVLMGIILGCATASQVARKPQALESNTEDSISLIAQVLNPQIKILDRNVLTFRYEDADHSFNPQTAGDIQNREFSWARRFYDSTKFRGSMIGPGVYVALDPNSTPKYGGADPQLFLLKLKQGSRLLVGDANTVKARDYSTVKGVLNSLSCIDNTKNKDPVPLKTYADILSAFRSSEKSECRELIIQVYKRLQIQATLYHFDSSTLKDCRFSGTAINIVDPSCIVENDINFYSANKRIEGDPLITPFVKKLFIEGINNLTAQAELDSFSMVEKYRNQFKLFENVPNLSEADFRVLKIKNILKCGDVSSVEDPNLKFAAFLKQNARINLDPEIYNLYLKAAFAYKAKFADVFRTPTKAYGSFVLSRVRMIEKLGFKNSGLIQDEVNFTKWRKIKSLMNDPSLWTTIPQKLKENAIGNLFEFERKMNRELDKMPSDNQKSPIALADLLNKIGAGPKTIQILFTTSNLDFGNIPIFEKNIPTDSRKDYTELLIRNKNKLKKILQQCELIYSDPILSMQDVLDSPCGIEKLEQ